MIRCVSLPPGLALLLCIVASSVAAQECVKTMRWADDPPFTFANPEQSNLPQGIDVELARLALAPTGCTLRFIKLPWARALEELKAGRVDLVGGAFRTEEREGFAHYSSVEFHSPNRLFIRAADAPDFVASRLAELRGKDFRFGIQIGVSYGQEFDALAEDEVFSTQLERLSSRQSLWQMLDLGRVDGVIADEMTGRLEVKQLGLESRISLSALEFPAAPSYFIFSRQTTTAAFVAQFDKHLRELIETAQYQGILDSYFK